MLSTLWKFTNVAFDFNVIISVFQCVSVGAERSTKGKATAGVFACRFLQIERFKRNVAPHAIDADIFEISVCEPVVRHSVAGAILQHDQEESLSHRLVSSFGQSVDRCPGAGRRILSRWCRCVCIYSTCRRWIRGNSRLHCPQGIEVITDRAPRLKVLSCKTRKVKHAASALRMGANSLCRAKGYFGEFFQPAPSKLCVAVG
jgi:hypothetical protein